MFSRTLLINLRQISFNFFIYDDDEEGIRNIKVEESKEIRFV
jgi:hypothetical protein